MNYIPQNSTITPQTTLHIHNFTFLQVINPMPHKTMRMKCCQIIHTKTVYMRKFEKGKRTRGEENKILNRELHNKTVSFLPPIQRPCYGQDGLGFEFR